MINIVVWFDDNRHREKLSLACARNNIRIVADEFENMSGFLKTFNTLDCNIDALAISQKILSGVDIKEFLAEIREREPNIKQCEDALWEILENWFKK